MSAAPDAPGPLRWTDRVHFDAERAAKVDLWRGERLFAGLTCLERGQAQAVHRHAGADKLYVVLRGTGTFAVGDATFEAAEGEVVPAPADVPHGVRNDDERPLVVLSVIAPPPRGA